VKGFHQIPGFDYLETFSHVVKPIIIRIVLTITLAHQWHQIDINDAFLYGDLEEMVFMVQPLDFEASNHNLVCKR